MNMPKLEEYAINPSTLDKEQIQTKMLRGNFSIGDEKNRSMKGASSSYQPAVANNNERGVATAIEGKPHKLVSVNFGSHRPNFVSETKQMFQGKAPDRRESGSYQMIADNNRNPHFKFDDHSAQCDPNVMKSVAHIDHDYKGNPMEIRQTLNPEVVKDLRQHHFNYGSHPTVFSSNSVQTPVSAFGMPIAVSQPESLKKALFLATQNKGLMSGPPKVLSPTMITKPTEFKTTNQIFSKWIQPAPSKDTIQRA